MKYKGILKDPTNLYKIDEEEIIETENELGFPLPSELKNFYYEMGCGFIDNSIENTNRIMNPNSILNFRLRRKEYEYWPEISFYDDYEDNKLIFFECYESRHFSMELKASGDCKIYWADDVIAHSLSEFLVRYQENPDYFFDLTE